MSNNLGKKLRQLRIIKNATLRKVEKKTQVSNGYINQLENGRIKQPSPHILHKLAKFYSFSYNELMELAGYIVVSTNQDASRKIHGVAFNLSDDLTKEEENELMNYLAFLRSKGKST